MLKYNTEYANLKKDVPCKNVEHILDFSLLKTVLASCKNKQQRFLLTATGNFSKTGATDTVPPFPCMILQKVCFSMDGSLCSSDHRIHHFTQFWA
jgi:hypothetical protein